MNFQAGAENVSPEGDANLLDAQSVIAFDALSSAIQVDPILCRGKETILLVEDAALVRKATAEALQSAGYRVLIAENATQALDAYHCYSHSVDLLLTDVVMSGMCGRELAQTLFALSPELRIMLMSGYAEQLALCKLSPYRTEYLPKPFSAPTLLRRVRQVLDQNPLDFGPPA